MRDMICVILLFFLLFPVIFIIIVLQRNLICKKSAMEVSDMKFF